MNPSSSPQPSPSAWQILGHRPLLETRIFSVRSTQFRHPTRLDERDFVVIDPPDWVNVIAVTLDGKIVLVRQFRYGANSFSLEIPGGVIERGELPEVAGVRELQEETGYVGNPARVLGSVQPNPAIQSNRCHFLLVEHAVATMPLAWDQDEEIELNLMPVEEAFALARSGGITHSLTLNAFFLFEPLWNEHRKLG
jgi:8-oxo-dGTP pyrophosphatase MutT (NUDIX family)